MTETTETTETVERAFLTADVVAFDAAGLFVLLVERKWDPYAGAWALPGGYANVDEASRRAAARELGEETGLHVDANALRRIDVWDDPTRDPRGRVVTVAYTITLPHSDANVVSVRAGDDANRASWWPLDALPTNLAFDHADIIKAAVALVF